MSWWRQNAAAVTFVLTLVVCAIGLAMGVPTMEVIGVFLLGLLLTVVNSLRRRGDQGD